MKYSAKGIKVNNIDQDFEDFFPIHNGMLLRRHRVVEKTESGLYIPESVAENADNMDEGDLAYEVLKVGPEVMNYKEGDYAIFGQNSFYAVALKHDKKDKELFYIAFENWAVGVFRQGAKAEDFKPTDKQVQLSSKGMVHGG